jgi:phytoene dehydrogenase-like protein
MLMKHFILVALIFLADENPVTAFTVGRTSRLPGSHHETTAWDVAPRLQSNTQLAFFRRLFGNKKGETEVPEIMDQFPLADDTRSTPNPNPKLQRMRGEIGEEVDVCIIGGGVAGLVAAAEAAKANKGKSKVVLLEASSTLGGRVQSDKTEDGYVLDRGFAVFIEEYPYAKQLLDYDKLNLGSFLPGALGKVKGLNGLARVADPLRQPQYIIDAILAPIGSLLDKVDLLPLIFHARSSSIESLFSERETDTLTSLKERWGFGDTILDRFFKPFLEGIYLAPLDEQSSRMFTFIFKMFSEGAATLPEGGMRAVSEQLANKAREAGVDLRTSLPVEMISQSDGGFLVKYHGQRKLIQTKSVILATDGQVAQSLVSQVSGFESLALLAEQPQRSVGCLYYAFDGEAPVTEPMLILNGIDDERGTEDNPVNNVCFPSVVSKGYAPEGHGLCSVTILENAMDVYKDRDEELDKAVRKQLGSWFPDYKNDILEKWQLKKIYSIKNAQPSQLGGPFPANVSGGRDCNIFRDEVLPEGFFICGDHMATATLNGALESGFSAGKAAGKAVAAAK